MGIIRKFTI